MKEEDLRERVFLTRDGIVASPRPGRKELSLEADWEGVGVTDSNTTLLMELLKRYFGSESRELDWKFDEVLAKIKVADNASFKETFEGQEEFELVTELLVQIKSEVKKAVKELKQNLKLSSSRKGSLELKAQIKDAKKDMELAEACIKRDLNQWVSSNATVYEKGSLGGIDMFQPCRRGSDFRKKVRARELPERNLTDLFQVLEMSSTKKKKGELNREFVKKIFVENTEMAMRFFVEEANRVLEDGIKELNVKKEAKRFVEDVFQKVVL